MFDLDKMITEAYGPDLDKMISEAYDSKAPMSIEKLSEMVENMLVLQESLGIFEDVEKSQPKGGDNNWENLRYLPIAQVSELKWGTAATDAMPVDNSAREQLATYLRQIPGTDIAEKINNLNEFIKNAGNSDIGIQQALSFLVFYRTLSMIITNFNAAAAGFIFESFLAVLLDAENGKQIPATDAETIADIIIYPNNSRLPISLKLYGENTITVGGSFKQMVLDLTTQYPVMQYIVVGKEYSGSKGGKALNKLNFYGFNFTLDNFPTVINYLGEAHAGELLQLPRTIIENWTGTVTRAFKSLLTNAEERTKIEGGAWEEKEITISDDMSGFKDKEGNLITGMKYQQIDFKIPRGNRVSPVFGYRAMREATVDYIKNSIYLPSISDPGNYEKLENILDDNNINDINNKFDEAMATRFIIAGKEALINKDAADKYNINNVTAEFGMKADTKEDPKFMFMSSHKPNLKVIEPASENINAIIFQKVKNHYEKLIQNIKNKDDYKQWSASKMKLETALKNAADAEAKAKVAKGGKRTGEEYATWKKSQEETKNVRNQLVALIDEGKKMMETIKKYNGYETKNIVFIDADLDPDSTNFETMGLKNSILFLLKKAVVKGVEVNKEKMKETGGVSPRTKKINQIWGSEGKKESLEILKRMAKSKDVEAYKILLRLTKGYNLSRQFDITRSKFESLMKSEALSKKYLPYGNKMEKGAFAVLDIGEAKVMEVTNRAFENINESMKTIFKNLYFLQRNINSFVADGMEKTTPAKEAKTNAEIISTATQEVIDEKSTEERTNAR
ncbi:MAG TPA: hypothetical protein DCX27_21545 [Balneola sp.]|nr:hypothetical protein [Balneola sp.]